MSWRSVLVVAWITLALPRAGLALGVQAQEHMTRGVALFDAGDYARAADEFSAGYELERDPELLYNWASAEFMTGHYQTALGLFRRVELATLAADYLAFATTSMAECERRLARRPDVVFPEVHIDAPPPPKTKAWYEDAIGGALTLGGVATIGLGLGFYLSAHDHWLAAQRAEDYPTLAREVTTANQQQLVALIATAAGTGLIVAGVLRYRALPRPRDGVTVAITAHGGFVGWGGAF